MGRSWITARANWDKVFGSQAEVSVHAAAIAKYVGQVAAAGKAIYPLPMYVNASLHDLLTSRAPVHYESGSPTDEAPRIYLSGAAQ